MLSFAVDVFFMLLLLFELSALDGDEELYTNTFFFHNCDIQINGLNSNIAIIKYETVTLWWMLMTMAIRYISIPHYVRRYWVTGKFHRPYGNIKDALLLSEVFLTIFSLCSNPFFQPGFLFRRVASPKSRSRFLAAAGTGTALGDWRELLCGIGSCSSRLPRTLLQCLGSVGTQREHWSAFNGVCGNF